nr:uncharacterized protein LOC127300543 [Lolium perenne]
MATASPAAGGGDHARRPDSLRGAKSPGLHRRRCSLTPGPPTTARGRHGWPELRPTLTAFIIGLPPLYDSTHAQDNKEDCVEASVSELQSLLSARDEEVQAL